MEEIWKKIVLNDEDSGWQVSSHGNFINTKGRILKGNVNNGYFNVSIKGKTYRAHRLVALNFCYKPIDCDCVDHIDHNKKNNHYTNLEWVTHKENMIRARKVLVYADPKRTPVKTVLKVMELSKEGFNNTQIGKKLNICRTIVYKIVNGTIWSSVTGIGYNGSNLDEFL